MEFAGRVALITGPAKGMGAAITLGFAREGADLALVGRDLGAIEPVAAEARALGRKVEIIACDVTDTAAVENMAVQATAAFGRIDILVNVAGGAGTLGKRFWEISRDDFNDIIDLNVTGCFLTMKAVMPSMIEQRYGKIVNVGGTFGLRGRALRTGYSTSKWGLRGLTKSAALEAGPYNVNVNSVCPGMVEGPRFKTVCGEMSKRLRITEAEAAAQYAAEYALRRVSTDQDVAHAVLFLASDKARQITGQDLAVDGGWVI